MLSGIFSSSLIQASNFSSNFPVPKRGFRDRMKLRENSGSPPERRHLNTGYNTGNLNIEKAPYSSQTPSTLQQSHLTLSINKGWSPVFMI